MGNNMLDVPSFLKRQSTADAKDLILLRIERGPGCLLTAVCDELPGLLATGYSLPSLFEEVEESGREMLEAMHKDRDAGNQSAKAAEQMAKFEAWFGQRI